MLTKEHLRELFDYVEGRLVKRRTGRGPCVGSGKRLTVTIDGRNEYHSRAVWVWHNGPLEADQSLRHANGDMFDERIENLQLVTPGDTSVEREKLAPGIERVGDRFSARYRGRLAGDYFNTALEAALARAEIIARADGLHRVPRVAWSEGQRAEFEEFRFVLAQRGARDPSGGSKPWGLSVPPEIALKDMRAAVESAERRGAKREKTAEEIERDDAIKRLMADEPRREAPVPEPPAEPSGLSPADKFMAGLMAEAESRLGADALSQAPEVEPPLDRSAEGVAPDDRAEPGVQ